MVTAFVPGIRCSKRNLSGAQLTAFERLVSGAVIAALGVPLALQLKTLHSRISQMKRNYITLDDNGILLRLTGNYRAGKGLLTIEDTRLMWSEILTIDRERRKFAYPSVIPFAYLLDVFVIRAEDLAVPFTSECVPRARKTARAIAARIAREGAAG